MTLVRFMASDDNQEHWYVGVWCAGENEWTYNTDGTLSTWATIDIDEEHAEHDSQGNIIAEAAMGRTENEARHAPRQTVKLNPSVINNLYHQLAGDTQTGELELTSDCAVDVYIDGALVLRGVHATTRTLDVGTYILRLVPCEAGYAEYSGTVVIKQGERTTITNPLSPQGVRVDAFSGGVQVVADVAISGNGVSMNGVTPCTFSVPPGTYIVHASYSGEDKNIEAVVDAGSVTPVNFQFQTANTSTGGAAVGVKVKLSLTVNGQPSSGSVRINDGESVAVGTSGEEVELRQGDYIATATVSGFTPKTVSFTVGDAPITVTIPFVNSQYTPPGEESHKPSSADAKRQIGAETMLMIAAAIVALLFITR